MAIRCSVICCSRSRTSKHPRRRAGFDAGCEPGGGAAGLLVLVHGAIGPDSSGGRHPHGPRGNGTRVGGATRKLARSAGAVHVRRTAPLVARRPNVPALGAPEAHGHAGSRRSRSCTWNRRRAAPSSRAKPAARSWISATRRSCRTCSPSRPARRSTFPNCDQHLPQRLLALEDAPGSTSGATPPAIPSPVRFDRPGIVRVFCDIHSHMNAFILVFSHPFFAVTDDEGRYRIDNVPPGTLHRRRLERGQRRRRHDGDGARRRRGRAGFHAAMRLLSSLRSRIFLASALLAVLVDRRRDLRRQRARDAGGRADARARRSSRPATLVEQLRTTRTQTFTLMARLHRRRAEAEGGRRHQRSADGAGHRERLPGAAQVEPAARDQRGGRCLRRSAASRAHGRVAASQPAIRDALAGRESVSLLPQPNGMLQLVTVPITIGLTAPEILGTLSVGFLLDDALAAQLKQITGSDVAFGMDGADPGGARCRARIARGARASCCAATRHVARHGRHARNTWRCRCRSRAGEPAPAARARSR